MHGVAIYPLAIQIASDQAGNAQNPALHLRHRALRRRQFGFQERGKAAVPAASGTSEFPAAPKLWTSCSTPSLLEQTRT